MGKNPSPFPPDHEWTDQEIQDSWPLFPYQPNKILPIVCAAIFGLFFAYHLFVGATRHCFRYWWAFVLGLFLECAGYAIRRYMCDHVLGLKNLSPFAITQLFIVIAPAFLAGSMYASYGRINRYVGPQFSPVRRVTRIFVSADVISIIIQGSGSGLFTSSSSKVIKLGKVILIVGFLIQLVGFATFSICSVVFFFRAKREIDTAGWSRALYGLWGACVFIFVRSVFRTLEFATGDSAGGQQKGALLTNETYFYIFEALMIFLAVVLLTALHPAYFIPRDATETLSGTPLPMTSYKKGQVSEPQPFAPNGTTPIAHQQAAEPVPSKKPYQKKVYGPS